MDYYLDYYGNSLLTNMEKLDLYTQIPRVKELIKREIIYADVLGTEYLDKKVDEIFTWFRERTDNGIIYRGDLGLSVLKWFPIIMKDVITSLKKG